MNSPYTAPKAQLGNPVIKRFSFRIAMVAYLTSIATVVTLTTWLGWLLTGKLPEPRGYLILLPYTFISSVAFAFIGGKVFNNSLLGAILAGIIGSVILLTITSVAISVWASYFRAV